VAAYDFYYAGQGYSERMFHMRGWHVDNERIATYQQVTAARNARLEGTPPAEVFPEAEVATCNLFLRHMVGKFLLATHLPLVKKRSQEVVGTLRGFSIGWLDCFSPSGDTHWLTPHSISAADYDTKNRLPAELFLCEDGTLRSWHGEGKYGEPLTCVPGGIPEHNRAGQLATRIFTGHYDVHPNPQGAHQFVNESLTEALEGHIDAVRQGTTRPLFSPWFPRN